MKQTLLALIPLAAFAQEMTGPTLGWSPTSDGRSLQAIYGVAGAARMGAAVAWPEEVREITLSPGGQRAVALDGWVPVIIDLASLRRTPLEGFERADVKVWSPLGSALLLARHETGEVRTYVQRAGGFELLNELTLPAESYAVSDDGTSILANVGEELLLRGPSGASVLGSKSTGFTFLARTTTPVFAQGTELVIGSTRYPLPAESATLASPAIGRILAIDRAAGQVIWFDDQGAQLADASCGRTIERVEPLGSAGTLKLVTSGDGPAWLTETSGTANRLFFVPQPKNPEPNNEVEQ